MTEENSNLRWQILPDDEVKRQEDDAFGVHSAYARLLLRIAKNCPTPFSIGLYSSWGTGKTSIVRLLQELVTKDKSSLINVVYLDVWKYSSDPLKRWILFETERQLSDQKLLEAYKYDDRTLQSHLEFEEQLEEKGKIEVDTKSLRALIYGSLLLVVFSFAAWFLIPSGWKSKEAVQWLFALVAGSGAVAVIFCAVFKKLAEEVASLVFRRSIKQITAKPAFSSEKFGQIFHNIVSRCCDKEPKRRLIFVFDNVDRCPADVAVEVISVVKTFLDEPGCVYVIPCDEQAILTHIKKNFVETPDSDPSDAYANQFLSKFFQMTLRLPPAADFAVEGYLDRELKAAKMEDLTTDARDVLVLGYRGETPRQVKRVLNDLIAYRGIAEQIETAGLVGRGVLTSDLGHLTKMAVLSVKWPSFVRMLADDPEKWVEVMEWARAQRGKEMDGVPPDLAQFLWNTRLVSPDADVRPWLYFTRGNIEKDVVLTRRVEQILQNGSWQQFRELLGEKGFADKKQEILQIAAATLRRWLNTERRLLLRNGGPVLLKAAIEFPDDAALNKIALDVLDYLAGNAGAVEMEQLFDVKDILSITKGLPTWQRSNLLGKYAELFRPEYPMTPARQEMCKDVIQNGELLEEREKSLISDALVNRYSIGNGETEVLQLIEISLDKPAKRPWPVEAALMARIIGAASFDNSDLDQMRVRVLVVYKSFLGPTEQKTLMLKLAAIVNPSRISQPDTAANCAIEFLKQLEPESIDSAALTPVAGFLLEQAKRSPLTGRAFWLEALIFLYHRFGNQGLGEMDTLFTSSFVDSDPGQAAKLSESLDQSTRNQILNIQRFRDILRAQPANYQKRYAGGAVAHRESYLLTFRSIEILDHPDLFDDSRSWDVALFIKNADRAVEEKARSSETIGAQVAKFCEKYLPANFATQTELHDALVELVEQRPEVQNVALAQMVATCELQKIHSGDLSAYSRYTKFKAMLPLDIRLDFTRELLRSLSPETDSWVPLLVLLVDDVISDDGVSKSSGVIAALADFSFTAAREKWTESGDILTKTVALLGASQQQDYVDRALEVLLGLSASGEDLPQMEPFLQLVSGHPGQAHGEIAAKIVRFIQRSLGAAQPVAMKLRALQFASSLDPTALTPLKDQITELSADSESEVSALATSLLDKL